MTQIEPRVVKSLEKLAEDHPCSLVFATVSGAHLYGFPSSDPDFDLRGAHLLPLDEVVGLKLGPETLDSDAIVDGYEMDVVSHDLAKFLRLMIKPNGYVLEQLLSPIVIKTSEVHRELCALSSSCITKNHSRHYMGFFNSQWKLFEKENPPRVKPLLYMYRVLMTGIHLMRTGEIEANLSVLNEEFQLEFINDFIFQKVNGTEKGSLDNIRIEFHRSECQKLLQLLVAESERTHLPETPLSVTALNDLLIRVRLQGLR